MRDLILLFVHVFTTLIRLGRPGGVRSVLAESILLRHQLLILNRSRRRAPNLQVSDRLIAGLCMHRVAISNHQLLAFDGDNVTFRWRDYAHGNVQRTMTVSAEEFIRRFLMHVPKSFVRIRHYGFMANYQRSSSFQLCRQLLKMAPALASPKTNATTSIWLCPTCQTPLTLVERLTAAQIAWRFGSKCYVDTS